MASNLLKEFPPSILDTINLLFSFDKNVGIKSKTLCILATSDVLKTEFPFLSFFLPKSVLIVLTILLSTLYASIIFLFLNILKQLLGNHLHRHI